MIQFFSSLVSGGSGSDQSNVFDNNFISSVVYQDEPSYNARSAFSEWKFQYSGTYLKVVVFTNINTVSWPGYASIELIIDGTPYQTLDFTSVTEIELTLPAGSKTIQLIDGALTKGVTDYVGTFLTEVWVTTSLFTKVNESNVSEKLVFLGDSITTGFAPTNPQLGTYSRLFSSDAGRNVGCLGWGGVTMLDMAGTSILRDATIADIQTLFSFATTTKKLVIALCSNDWAEANDPAVVDTAYKDLIDTLNGLDNTIEMWCISPLLRAGENAAMDTIRANILSMCSTRAFATYIDGEPLVSSFHDGVHPSNTGHIQFYDAIKGTI